MEGKLFRRLTLLCIALAVAMNFYLFAYDRHHSNEPAVLIMNHLMSITLWFVIFAFLSYVIILVVLIIKAVAKFLSKE